MARPIDADAAATRKRILDSASVMFAERGSGSTSMRQIARGAGVSQATIHHYFGTKESLYEACIDAMYDELGDLKNALAGEVTSISGPQELADRIIRVTFRFGREHTLALKLNQRLIINTGELTTHHREQHLIPFLDQVVELFAFTGQDKLHLRMCINSISYVVVRYALASSRELARVMGASVEDAERPEVQQEALAAAENHLVVLAKTLMGLDAPRAT